MTSSRTRDRRDRGLAVERLEDRLLPDVAPIGPIISPDNLVPYNHAYFHRINASHAAVDVPALMRINSPEDAARVRASLIDFVWKADGFPSRTLPDEVAFGVGRPLDPAYPPLPNLRRIDRLTVTMDHGLRSGVYFFHPERGSGRVAIWQQGHDPDLGATGGYRTIAGLLAQGDAVLALWLPLYAENSQQKPFFIGKCFIDPALADHDQLACAETAAFTPLEYFVQPVAVALNYALETYGFDDVAMIGLSGGGWTTTLYAALDPRVRISVPVAGTLPAFLRTPPYDSDGGDWEQHGSAIYGLADYLDWYVLSADGPGRLQVQVLNKFDDCCFAGVRYRTYLDHVADAVAGLGEGTFRVFLDDSERFEAPGRGSHQVSAHAVATAIQHALADSAVQLVDDGDNTYWNARHTDRDTHHTKGPWRERLGLGFAGDTWLAGPGAGRSQAVWQFRVAPGRYQVAVTWDPRATPAAGLAPFAVFDGETLLKEITVDQRLAPADFLDAQAAWLVLGEFDVTGSQLRVRLTDASDAVVIADGARVVRLEERSPPERALVFRLDAWAAADLERRGR